MRGAYWGLLTALVLLCTQDTDSVEVCSVPAMGYVNYNHWCISSRANWLAYVPGMGQFGVPVGQCQMKRSASTCPSLGYTNAAYNVLVYCTYYDSMGPCTNPGTYLDCYAADGTLTTTQWALISSSWTTFTLQGCTAATCTNAVANRAPTPLPTATTRRLARPAATAHGPATPGTRSLAAHACSPAVRPACTRPGASAWPSAREHTAYQGPPLAVHALANHQTPNTTDRAPPAPAARGPVTVDTTATGPSAAPARTASAREPT